MAEDYLLLDCRNDGPLKTQFSQHRRRCFDRNQPFAVLSILTETDVRVRMELPPGRRLTAHAYWALQGSGLPRRGEDILERRLSTLLSDGPTRFGDYRYTGVRGDVVFGRDFDHLDTAREYIELLAEIVAKDSQELRWKEATRHSPEVLYEKRGGASPYFQAEHGNIGPSGFSFLTEDFRADFGLEPLTTIPDERWKTLREILSAVWQTLLGDFVDFEEIVWLNSTCSYLQENVEEDSGVRLSLLREVLPSLRLDTLANFVEVNSFQDWQLGDAPIGDGRARLLGSDGCTSFRDFHRNHPKAQGVLSLSRVGLSDDGDEALLELQNHVDLGLLDAANYGKSTSRLRTLFGLRKGDGGWRIIEKFGLEEELFAQLTRAEGFELGPGRRGPTAPFSNSSDGGAKTEKILSEALKELEGYTPSYDGEPRALLGYRIAERVWGVYRNRRHQPQEIVFSSHGLRIMDPWTETLIPYTDIEQIRGAPEPYRVRLILSNGRERSLILDGLVKTENLLSPKLDCDWFLSDFRFYFEAYLESASHSH